MCLWVYCFSVGLERSLTETELSAPNVLKATTPLCAVSSVSCAQLVKLEDLCFIINLGPFDHLHPVSPNRKTCAFDHISAFDHLLSPGFTQPKTVILYKMFYSFLSHRQLLPSRRDVSAAAMSDGAVHRCSRPELV